MFIALMLMNAMADEGMWLPEQLPEVGPAWAERGLALDPETLSDPLQHPLGAIVSLGFCSASFVSPEGLMVTNHHCVEGFLQYNSTGERNLHRDGMLAADRAGELSVGPAGRVWVVESIEDVTEQLVDRIGRRTTDARRTALLEQAEKRLLAECERRPNRRCRVAQFDGGASYRLISALEIQDVRLVYAPPMGLGQFGGDVDNWMWPRQSGDFAVLRAYVGADGESAPFDESNVPYQPEHWLRVNPDGASDGDFVMIAGYPGRTNRHARARTLSWMARDYLPLQIDLLRELIDIYQAQAQADPEAEARLGSRISSLQNGLKNSEGLLAGLDRGDLIAARTSTEDEILAWVEADRRRKRRWAKPLAEQRALLAREQAEAVQDLTLSLVSGGADLLRVATWATRWAEQKERPDVERELGFQDRDLDRQRASLHALDKRLHLPSGREVFAAIFARYQALPAERRVEALDAWIAEQGGLASAMDRLFTEPALAAAEARLALLDLSLDELRASDDPWVGLALAIETWAAPRREEAKADDGAHHRLDPAWYAVLDAWYAEQGRYRYPDANNTLRLTLGHVRGYAPEDGLRALPQTTVAGLRAKAGPAPFNAPDHLLDRAPAAPQSRFADPALGDVPVNFLSTLDITGGNSGSAVLDGEGRLVGLAFDGNWESIASDWVFLPEVSRTISVDVRYLGWVLDGTEGAEPLLVELGLSEGGAP